MFKWNLHTSPTAVFVAHLKAQKKLSIIPNAMWIKLQNLLLIKNTIGWKINKIENNIPERKNKTMHTSEALSMYTTWLSTKWVREEKTFPIKTSEREKIFNFYFSHFNTQYRLLLLFWVFFSARSAIETDEEDDDINDLSINLPKTKIVSLVSTLAHSSQLCFDWYSPI